MHNQPDGSQLASTRYYRIVFHCNILPGALYLRFAKLKPFRTVVQNRQDPSSKDKLRFSYGISKTQHRFFPFFLSFFLQAIFAFRSVGAYSRVQIRSHMSNRWLCMNDKGKIVQKVNMNICLYSINQFVF